MKDALRSSRRNVDLVVVVNGFPRLSETFVLQELLELERRGLRLHVIALRRPDEVIEQEAVRELSAEVEYLPDLSENAPRLALRIAQAALLLRRRVGYLHGVAAAIASPDFSRSRLHLGLLLAHRVAQLGSPPIYVHFAHKPATIGRFAALLAGVPYALSTHAKDIWLTSERELACKVRDAAVVLTCTSDGHSLLDGLARGRTPIRLVYHGVDLTRPPRIHCDPDLPVVLSVGRLVEKKGYSTLLRAASLLRRRGLEFRLRIAGEGPEWSMLQRLVHDLELGDAVSFLGPLSDVEVRTEYDRADVFALACRELESGDRDGIPNVVLEAMAHGLPVVSTTGGGVGEAVVDGKSGFLVPQDDPEAFAAALARILQDGPLRARVGGAARERVAGKFDRDVNLPLVVEALAEAGIVRSLSAEGSVSGDGDKRNLRAVA
jgi:glycosyltransferase involved in cell wall biosynthesis